MTVVAVLTVDRFVLVPNVVVVGDVGTVGTMVAVTVEVEVKLEVVVVVVVLLMHTTNVWFALGWTWPSGHPSQRRSALAEP